MCGSFNVQPTKRNNYPLVVGDNYKVNERQSQMIIDRITDEYKKKKVVKF